MKGSRRAVGDFIDFCGLAYSPSYKNGTVSVFGKVVKYLNVYILPNKAVRVRGISPTCTGRLTYAISSEMAKLLGESLILFNGARRPQSSKGPLTCAT